MPQRKRIGNSRSGFPAPPCSGPRPDDGPSSRKLIEVLEAFSVRRPSLSMIEARKAFADGVANACALPTLEALDGPNQNDENRAPARLPIPPPDRFRQPQPGNRNPNPISEASYLPSYEKPNRPRRQIAPAPHPDKNQNTSEPERRRSAIPRHNTAKLSRRPTSHIKAQRTPQVQAGADSLHRLVLSLFSSWKRSPFS